MRLFTPHAFLFKASGKIRSLVSSEFVKVSNCGELSMFTIATVFFVYYATYLQKRMVEII